MRGGIKGGRSLAGPAGKYTPGDRGIEPEANIKKKVGEGGPWPPTSQKGKVWGADSGETGGWCGKT